MAYKNGTYVAFSWNKTRDPTKSDIKYFNTLKMWDSVKSKDFSFINSHEKTYQVRDTSTTETLMKVLSERLNNSKQFFLIITDISRYNTGMLNWEIDRAINHYKLPIIVVYPGYSSILNPNRYSDLWPKSLKDWINNGIAKCIHIPFKETPIITALEQFSINDRLPKWSEVYYTENTYRGWDLL